MKAAASTLVELAVKWHEEFWTSSLHGSTGLHKQAGVYCVQASQLALSRRSVLEFTVQAVLG